MNNDILELESKELTKEFLGYLINRKKYDSLELTMNKNTNTLRIYSCLDIVMETFTPVKILIFLTPGYLTYNVIYDNYKEGLERESVSVTVKDRLIKYENFNELLLELKKEEYSSSKKTFIFDFIEFLELFLYKRKLVSIEVYKEIEKYRLCEKSNNKE